MDLVYVLPIGTCSYQILLYSVLTPQLMPLGRAGDQNLGQLIVLETLH